MKKQVLVIILLMMITIISLKAQEQVSNSIKYDIVNLGLGLGLDYGGIGVNLTAYPMKYVGVFVGGGYALAGFGYNVGVKMRYVNDKRYKNVNPFFIAMYGYNAAIKVLNRNRLDKLFYGPSIGIGVDLGPKKPNGGYLSFSINVPIREPEVGEYIENLKNNYGVKLSSGLLPIAFSIAYKFSLF